jgi:hypothetical protein
MAKPKNGSGKPGMVVLVLRMGKRGNPRKTGR